MASDFGQTIDVLLGDVYFNDGFGSAYDFERTQGLIQSLGTVSQIIWEPLSETQPLHLATSKYLYEENKDRIAQMQGKPLRIFILPFSVTTEALSLTLPGQLLYKICQIIR